MAFLTLRQMGESRTTTRGENVEKCGKRWEIEQGEAIVSQPHQRILRIALRAWVLSVSRTLDEVGHFTIHGETQGLKMDVSASTRSTIRLS